MRGKIIMGIVLCLTLLACSEDKMDAFENTGVIRFTFPQGDHSWDKRIAEIADEYGVYIIYKDYTQNDLNKSWVYSRYSPVYSGECPSEDQIEAYLNVVDKWILSTYDTEDPEVLSDLPVYFYMVNNYYSYDPIYEENSFMRMNLKGFDYWSLSFTTEELEGGLEPAIVHGVACTFGYKSLINRLDTAGMLVSDFKEMTDYETGIGTKYISKEMWLEEHPGNIPSYEGWSGPLPYEKSLENVYYRRGFVSEIKPTFDGETGAPIMYMPLWNWPYGEDRPLEERITADFLNYVRFAMSYPKSAIDEKYPVDTADEALNKANRLIHDKWNWVVDYVKRTYNVDLTEYAKILE